MIRFCQMYEVHAAWALLSLKQIGKQMDRKKNIKEIDLHPWANYKPAKFTFAIQTLSGLAKRMTYTCSAACSAQQ